MNDDTISRSALINELTQQIAYFADKVNTTSLINDTYAYNYCKEGLILAKMIIENAPAIEPSQNAEHDALQYSKGYQAGFLEAKKLHGETEGEWLDNVFIGGYVCNNCNAGYSSNPKTRFALYAAPR